MILGQTLYEIFRSSLIMVILLLASIAALTLIIERWWYFAKNRVNSKWVKEFFSYLRSGDLEGGRRYAERLNNPLGRLFLLALENRRLAPDELSNLFYGQILEERVRYERYLGGMGTLANGATLLGLLGTVVGLIKAFHNIAITGSGGPAVVSRGIAEALLTTAFGLFIGIPTLFFYNYFTKKASDLSLELEGIGERLIVTLYAHKGEIGEKEEMKREEKKEYWQF
uniref:MotA/TolQ/ExbB proton channel family protein n=1 Tax=candidate division WOR-3 bacterium TaxID=2052148 RepID=A0A7C3URI5_UNCW3